MTAIRAYGPPTAAKGDVRRRREFDDLVLGCLEHHGTSMSATAITDWLGVRYPYGSVETVITALKRLQRTRKVEHLGRAVGWRVKEGR